MVFGQIVLLIIVSFSYLRRPDLPETGGGCLGGGAGKCKTQRPVLAGAGGVSAWPGDAAVAETPAGDAAEYRLSDAEYQLCGSHPVAQFYTVSG